MKNGVLTSLLHFNRQKYCDRRCMVEGWLKEGEVGTTTPGCGRTKARNRKPKGPCEMCGKENARDVHHIDHDTANNRPENLMRICRSCHNNQHKKRAICKICGLPAKGHEYCSMHLERFKKYGNPLMVKDNQFVPVRLETEKNPARVCKAEGCTRPYHANGYCGMHAQRARRGKL